MGSLHRFTHKQSNFGDDLTEVQIWVYEQKKFFFAVFGLYFTPLIRIPWILIFLRIRIYETKILRIRILSTAFCATLYIFSPNKILLKRNTMMPICNILFRFINKKKSELKTLECDILNPDLLINLEIKFMRKTSNI